MTASPKPEQKYPPREYDRQKSRSVYYPQCRVTVSVVFENFGDPKAPKVFPVLPRSVSVQSNSYKEADTFNLEFDAKDLPVSPDLVRAGAVEIYLFNALGIGQIPEVVRAKDNPDTPQLEGLEPTIAGLFDDVTTEFSDGGRIVTISGTDYTALFTAKQWNPKNSGNGKGRIPSGRPLDDVLRKLMGQVESAGAMSLKVITPSGFKMPVVGAAEGKSSKRGLPVQDGQTYWDVMYTLAVRYGFILFVRNLDLVLTTPQAYVADRSAVRKMAWGRNLTSLRMSRKIGKEQVPVIEVRSYDSKRRKVLRARYPKNPKQKAVTGLGTKRDETRIYNIPGVRSEKQLAQIAETTYNLLARAEQQVEIETMDLADLEGKDLIELRNGDAIAIKLEPYTTDLLEGQSDAQRRKTLMDLGYDAGVAAEIAAGFDRLSVFSHPFRVKEATLEWSHDGGLHIAAALQSFVNIAGQAP